MSRRCPLRMFDKSNPSGPEMTGSIYIRRMTTTLSAPPNSYFQLLVTLPSESYVNVGIEVSTALNEFTVRTSIVSSLQFMNEGRVLHAALLKSDRKSTRLNSSHYCETRMPSSAGQNKRKTQRN